VGRTLAADLVLAAAGLEPTGGGGEAGGSGAGPPLDFTFLGAVEGEAAIEARGGAEAAAAEAESWREARQLRARALDGLTRLSAEVGMSFEGDDRAPSWGGGGAPIWDGGGIPGVGGRVLAISHAVSAYACRLEDATALTACELRAFREESRERDLMLQAELQKLQLLVTAQTRAYVAAFAQKKRKAVQLEAQLGTLLGSVKLIAAKQGQTDELCADLKEGLHKMVSGRRGVHLY